MKKKKKKKENIFWPIVAFSMKITSTSTSTAELTIHQASPPITRSKGERVLIRALKYPAAKSNSIISPYLI